MTTHGELEGEARERTRAYLKPKAWKKMMEELEPWDGQEHLLDPRDAEPFIEGIKNELRVTEAMGQYPQVVFEEYSPSIPKPRTVHLLEALKFLCMSGHVAMINDIPAPKPRNGFLAQILVI